MKKLIVFIASLICFASNAADLSRSKFVIDDATKLIEVWLDAEKDYENIPSIMGFIVDDQETLWSGTFSDTRSSIVAKVTHDTQTSLCSTSKVFTATAVMKLVEEGKVNLDDDIMKWIPELTLDTMNTDGGPITIRSLLSHTSGLPRDARLSYWSGPKHAFPTIPEMFESLKLQPMENPVGKTMSYGNINYALLGILISRVTGSTYKDFMETAFFNSLHMNDSTVELPISDLGRKHAVGFTAKGRNGQRAKANSYQTRALQSAAGISTSLNDLITFVKWQFRLIGSNDHEYLNPETLNRMYQTHGQSEGFEPDRGYGYVVNTDKNNAQWAMHGGMCPGYVNFLKLDVTNKRGYAILINANGIRALKYVNGLIEILRKFEQAPKQSEQQHASQASLEQYAGFYDLNPWNSEYYVTPWGSDIMLMYLPAGNVKQSMYQYRQVAKDTFRLVENGEVSQGSSGVLTFNRDAKGNVVSVTNDGQRHQKLSY